MKITPVLFGLSLLLGASGPADAAVTFRKVVVGANQTGDPAPGTDAHFSSSFRAPSINREGALVFQAETAGSAPKCGIWTADAGGKLKLIAIEGALAPGTEGKFTDLDFRPVIDEHGAVAFYGVTDVPGETGPVDDRSRRGKIAARRFHRQAARRRRHDPERHR